MAERTYLWGYSGTRRSRATIDSYWQVSALDPEFRRRVWALCDAAIDEGTDLGIGGGTRTYAQQAALYKARNGIGVAPPGFSYHESEATPLGAAAVDLVGDMAWNVANSARFHLVNFHHLGEDWHDQPDDLPNSRTTYKKNPSAYPIIFKPLPDGVIPPPPPPGDLISSAPPAPLIIGQPINDDTLLRTRWLQQILNERFGGTLKVDGGFGKQTQAAAIVMQQILGVTADGAYGPKTAAALAAWLLDADVKE